MTSSAAGVRTTFGVGALTAMVVGSMVGAGVFSLPARFAERTGVWGTLGAWAVAGAGTLTLALVFQTLAVRRPALDAGIYAYAKTGFGEYPGFLSVVGYWASACAGNVTYWVLVMSTLGAVVPTLGQGDSVLAVVLASAGLWAVFSLVRPGVTGAVVVNRVVTVAKVVPIVVFVVLCATLLDPQVLAENLSAPASAGSFFSQLSGVTLVTVFVFLGVEGASVYSRHARRRRDVGRATVLGFVSVLALFASVSVVSYGILPADQLAALRQPSMAGVLEAAVGGWGGVLVGVGLVVSVLGAYLAWTLMAAEVLLVAARDGDLPRFLARSDARDTPTPALFLTSALAQVLLVLTLLSADAFDFALDLTATLAIVPYVLAAAFAVRVGVHDRHRTETVVAVLATAYTLFLLVAAGPAYLLVVLVVYAPASVLFARARHEAGRRAFSRAELAGLVAITAGAVVGVVCLATGALHL